MTDAVGTAISEPKGVAGGGTAAVEITGADERLAYRGVFQRLFIRPEIGAMVGAAAIWAFFWAVAREFGTAGGAASILDVAATLGIMAVAVSLLMIGGEFDLSSGAATGALAIVTILLVKDVGELGGAGLSLWVAIPMSLVLALGLGWMNGTMVERTGLPSFIVTLATFFILRGFKLGFSKLTIDNLTVGPIEDGEGYEFWHPIFAYVWTRTEHQFDSRDLVYTVAVLGGLTLVALAVVDLNFRHSATKKLDGLVAAALGAVGVVAGVLYLHNSDGVTANAIGAAIIGVSSLVLFVGFGRWHLAPQAAGSLSLAGPVVTRLGLGLGLVALGLVLGAVLDVESQERVLDMVGPFRWVVVALAAAGAGRVAFSQQSGDASRSIQALIRVGSVMLAAAAGVYSFLFMTTEQGLRVILLGAGVAAGLVVLAIAAREAGRRSPLGRAVALGVTAASVVVTAFYIRDQSVAAKFRSELFSVLLASALALAVWAVLSVMFETRSAPDQGTDRFGMLLVRLGLVAVGIGMVVKLLFTTTTEIELDLVNKAGFRISILWFFGFTALAVWLLGRTRFGSWVYAVGGNKDAARQVGVPAARTKTQLFMIVSVAAWLVGLLLAFRLSTVQSVAGNGLEFEYIIAAVVGGTLLTGGYGSAFGAAIGAIIMAMSKTGIPAARWNSDWRFAFLGVILLAAVIANNFIKRRAEVSSR